MFRLAIIALQDDVSINFKKKRLYFFQIHRWYLESVEILPIRRKTLSIQSIIVFGGLMFVDFEGNPYPRLCIINNSMFKHLKLNK